MSRWIDADALIDALEYDIAIDEDILNYVGTEGIQRTTTQFDKDCKQNAIELLLRTPTIDLVRCGECKYWGNSYICWRRRAKPIAMNPDDFCSYGEAKEK